MTKDEQKEINDLANDLCYQRLKFSSLWNGLGENIQVDKKAEDLAALIRLHLEELVSSEELALEVQREVAA